MKRVWPLFSGIPADLEGEVTYANEEDLIAKSLAANIHGAIEGVDIESLLGLMQSAVDFKNRWASLQSQLQRPANRGDARCIQR